MGLARERNCDLRQNVKGLSFKTLMRWTHRLRQEQECFLRLSVNVRKPWIPKVFGQWVPESRVGNRQKAQLSLRWPTALPDNLLSLSLFGGYHGVAVAQPYLHSDRHSINWQTSRRTDTNLCHMRDLVLSAKTLHGMCRDVCVICRFWCRLRHCR